MPTPATMTRETGLHVAIIRQRYNAFGGAERFIERTLQALGREGVRITVIARDWSGPRSGSDWLRCDPRHVGRAWRDASFRRAACALVPPGRFHLVQSHERLSCCDVYRAGDGVHAQWLANRSRAGSAWMRVSTALSPYHRQLLAAERRMFTSPRLRAVICNSRMVREEIQLKNVTYADLLDGGIGYIRLERFSNNTGDEVASAINAMKAKGDQWILQAKLKYREQEFVMPIPVTVKFVDETAIIVVDNLTFAYGGIYSARLMIHERTYSGWWSGGRAGGMLYGTITNAE
mgnify:CR=1 FL=1